MIASDICINIIGSIIYDVAKILYLSEHFQKPRLEKQINKYLSENCNQKYSNLLENCEIDEFIKLPQIRDTIVEYIACVITGTYSERLKRFVKDKARISEDIVIKYLSDQFIAYKGDTVVIHNYVEISGLFKNLLEISNNFFLLKLARGDQALLYGINRNMNSLFGVLDSKLDKIMQIQNSMKFPLVGRNSNYDETRTQYMKILKDKYNKALIYLLDEFEIDKFYIAPELSRNRKELAVPTPDLNSGFIYRDYFSLVSSQSESWENIFRRENVVYISGGAGYGKSLLMKNIIINYAQLNVTSSKEHIVIYGEIKWFINKDGSFRSMIEFLIECINNSTLLRVNEEFINYHLSMGRCILLLDALDEVPMELRRDLHKTIMANLKSLNPNNKVCITSRDRGFIPVEGEIEHFIIKSLSPSHIEKYVDKIIALKKFNINDKEPFLQQADGLVKKGFLNSFLVLSLLINIYKGEKQLPETKLELYQKCFEYISNKREIQKTRDNFDWKSISPLMKDNTFIELSCLCFPNNKEIKEAEASSRLINVYRDTFIDQASLQTAVTEFLSFCCERTELFVPANIENTFRFFTDHFSSTSILNSLF